MAASVQLWVIVGTLLFRVVYNDILLAYPIKPDNNYLLEVILVELNVFQLTVHNEVCNFP